MELKQDFLLAQQSNGISPSESPIGNGQIAGTSAGTPQMSVILTIRLLMQSKEVGSIIGKKGDHVKSIREKSGAKVNISDGSCPERIVTITGNVETINKAFSMICRKSEEDLQALPNSVPQPPITMRLIVPATQCGSLIGKRGSKIKEIREATGASIQVASEMLPNSTERAVTISGTCNAIIDCMQEICHILLEAPPKGTNLPFRPKPSYNPLLIASSAAAAAAAQQQATQHLTAVMMQQSQNQQQQQQQLQQNAAAAVYNSGVLGADLTRLHPILAVPRFNLPQAALFSNHGLAGGFLPGASVLTSTATGVDPAMAALFQKEAAAVNLAWSQQQQQVAAAQAGQQSGMQHDEKHQTAVSAAQTAAQNAAIAAGDRAALEYLPITQPYIFNNSMLVGRTMNVNGTPLKLEHSNGGASVMQPTAASRRFSPY